MIRAVRRAGYAAWAAVLCTALLLSLPALAQPSTQPEPRPEQPRGVSDPKGALIIKDRYLFGPIMARAIGDRIHMQFYRGEQHYWKGRATVGYAVSDDDGRTWQERPDVVASDKAEIYDRFAAFGRARTGRLITLFSRRFAVNEKPQLYQVISSDDGESWSVPAPVSITAADGVQPSAGWMYPYGPIERTPDGKLAVMTYAGEDNFVLTSTDHGNTWSSRLIISSKLPNYSEMGLEILSETQWIAVSRIDGKFNRMAQFVTEDAGVTWRLLGGLDIQESAVYAAPTVDTLTINGKKVLFLSYCDRRPKKCWLQQADLASAAGSALAWGAPALLDQGFVGLSGYQSILQSRDGRELIVAITRERSTAVSDIVIWRMPIPEGRSRRPSAVRR